MSPEISPITIAAKTAEVAIEVTRFVTWQAYLLFIKAVNLVEGTPEQKRARKALKQESHDRA